MQRTLAFNDGNTNIRDDTNHQFMLIRGTSTKYVSHLSHSYCVKQLDVFGRAMTLYDARINGTSGVLTVPSLQRLKVEALIPAPTDCEFRSEIKFLNLQSIAPLEIQHQLC